MFSIKKQFVLKTLSAMICIALTACAATSVLPDNKLLDTASSVIGKPVSSVTNVRSVGDNQFFDAKTNDGTVYACSLQVILGMTSQHQKCERK